MTSHSARLVFAFVEDGTLCVFPNVAAAVTEFEGVDVESGTVHFYDEEGTYLEPRFSSPNQGGQILGALGWVKSGTYDLVPNAAADQDAFALALHETQLLEPNAWFSSLHDLRAKLRERGVAVDYIPTGSPKSAA